MAGRELAEKIHSSPVYAGVIPGQSFLHDYQVEGVKWLLTRLHPNIGNPILADEMGLGKTVQTLSVVRHFAGDLARPSLPSMVVCPLTVLRQWSEQAQMFFPDLKVTQYYGDKPALAKIKEELEATNSTTGCPFNVLITTFETVVTEQEFLGRVRWNLLVVDEAHRLKNPDTILYRCLSDEYSFKRKLLLTGTPVQNNLAEFIALLRFLHPNDFNVDSMDGAVCSALVLRRLGAQVKLNLPPRTEYTIKLPMTSIQRKLYRWAVTRYSESASLLLPQLRKICNHPYLIPGVEPEPFAEGEHIIGNSCKFKILDSLLLKILKNGSKVLIFSGSTQLLDIVQDFLSFRKLQYQRLDGSIRGDDRAAAVVAFGADECSIFLLSTRAGGLGLNLTQADSVIFMDCDWNPHADKQAIARAHRQGQKSAVTVYRLLCEDTVDELIFSRAQSKLKIADELLGPEDPPESLVAFGLDRLLAEPDNSEFTAAPPVAERNPLVDDFNVDELLAAAAVEEEGETEANSADAAVLANLRKQRMPRDRRTGLSEDERAKIASLIVANRERRQLERKAVNYVSLALTPNEDVPINRDSGTINYLTGDVTRASGGFIFFCVDASGRLPAGNLSAAVSNQFPTLKNALSRAKFASDLSQGSVHALKSDGMNILAAVCLERDGDIDMDDLKICFQQLSALPPGSALHLPRLGEVSGDFYTVEKLVKNYVCPLGINSYFYYFKREDKSLARQRIEAFFRGS